VFYCDRCAQRDGRKRILAVAERGPDRHWRLSVFRRAGRAPAEPGVAVATSRTGGVPHGERKRVAMQVGRRLVLVPLHPFATAAQLICRHCKARPRPSRTKLVEMAEQTVAKGRRDAYA
jgi:hypothetical protein